MAEQFLGPTPTKEMSKGAPRIRSAVSTFASMTGYIYILVN